MITVLNNSANNTTINIIRNGVYFSNNLYNYLYILFNLSHLNSIPCPYEFGALAIPLWIFNGFLMDSQLFFY